MPFRSVLLYASDNNGFVLLFIGIGLAIFLYSYFFSKKARVKKGPEQHP